MSSTVLSHGYQVPALPVYDEANCARWCGINTDSDRNECSQQEFRQDEAELRTITDAFHPEDVARVRDERRMKGESGQIIRWYATDIDDQNKAEENLRNENLVLREEIDHNSMFEEIVGSCEPIRQLLKQVEKVAPSDSTILILGETGTGKELIARALHRRSKRANRAFVKVNCAAIPQSLIASELFGHEKGAFTGAL